MILLEFECSIDVLNQIIESESGFFKKSSETIESLSLKFFFTCQQFCTETFTSSQQYFLSYASSSIDKAVRTTNNDPLNIIEFRDSDSILDKRIMEDWLVKNKDREGFSPHFICVLIDESNSERVIEPILQSTNMLRGSVYVSERTKENVNVSVMEYPAFRLDGAVIGGVDLNYSLERLNPRISSQLNSLLFFADSLNQTKSSDVSGGDSDEGHINNQLKEMTSRVEESLISAGNLPSFFNDAENLYLYLDAKLEGDSLNISMTVETDGSCEDPEETEEEINDYVHDNGLTSGCYEILGSKYDQLNWNVIVSIKSLDSELDTSLDAEELEKLAQEIEEHLNRKNYLTYYLHDSGDYSTTSIIQKLTFNKDINEGEFQMTLETDFDVEKIDEDQVSEVIFDYIKEKYLEKGIGQILERIGYSAGEIEDALSSIHYRIQFQRSGGSLDTSGDLNGHYDVVIESASVNTVEAIKGLRRVLDLGLKGAKDIADNLPAVVERNVIDWRATRLADDLRQAGFEVTVSPSQKSHDTNEKGARSSDFDPNGLTVLHCDLDVFAFRNQIENLPNLEIARKTLNSVGLELENNLNSSIPPSLIVYKNNQVVLVPYEKVTESDIQDSISENSINIAVKDLTEYDWEGPLLYTSTDADTRILAVGYHPSFDQPVRQIYDCGELDTGIIEDRDLDLYGSDDVANMFNEFLRL